MKKLVCVCVLLANPIHSAENDPYLAWSVPLSESRLEVNRHVNSYVDTVLAAVNLNPEKNLKCEDIAGKIGFAFSKGYEQSTKEWAEHNGKIEVHPPRTVSKQQYFAMSIYQDGRYHKLARILLLNGIKIGTDKLAHSISLGYVYYTLYQGKYHKHLAKGFSREVADLRAQKDMIDFGINTEKTMMGSWTTGVFSFSDLEANYQGMQFYLDFCRGPSPILSKNSDNTWQTVREVDFAAYVSPYWNEIYFPSTFKEKEWPVIQKRIASYCNDFGLELFETTNREYNPRALKKSLNIRYLEELVKRGELPSPYKHGYENVCKVGS